MLSPRASVGQRCHKCRAIAQQNCSCARLTFVWAFVIPLSRAKRLGWRNRGAGDGSLGPALGLSRLWRRGPRQGLPGDSRSRNAAGFSPLRSFRRRLGCFSGLGFRRLRFGLGLFASCLRGLLGLLQDSASLLELCLRQPCPFTSRRDLLFCRGGHGAQVNFRLGVWLLVRLHSSVPDESAPASATETVLKAGSRSQST
jgi:hypothetical protein